MTSVVSSSPVSSIRPPVIGQEKMSELQEYNQQHEGGTKPPLPPKPTLEPEPSLPKSPKLSDNPCKLLPMIETSPPTGTGSEKSSRSFHPEGSIDLSPSCSESLPTTPPYLKWAENIQYLLDDGDGCALFKQYLDQQSLGHLLEFVFAVKGFKIQSEADPDSDSQIRLVKTINKRYVNSLGKFMKSRIECFSQDQRKCLEDKVSSKSSVDTNIFDGLYQTVVEHLESKCYPNFLTSDIYIEHVQSYQTLVIESDVTSLKYLSSNASSVCGHGSHNRFNDDSGISGVNSEMKENLTASVTSPGCPSQADMMSSVSTSVSQLLPTVKEDSELNLSASSASKVPTVQAAFGARPKTMSKSLSALPAKEAVSISTNAAYPYHANSSTWNPVSRQDSELQSQSSGHAGPGGPGSDVDNHSSFRPPMEPPAIRPSSRPIKKPSLKPKNKETQFIPRPKIPMEPYTLATENPAKFAEKLCQKLNHVLIKQNSDTKLKGILDLNKTKSSVSHQDNSYDHELESDQSILDEHVDRVFNERQHNVSSLSQMDTSRHNASSYSGYRTLDSVRHHQSHFGHPGPHYRGMGHPNPNLAGDLAYYPSGKSGTSKSFSDTGFGMPRQQLSYQPPYQSGYGNDRVSDWLKNTSLQMEPSNQNFVKTSPRNSGRHQKRTRSQDRYGVQQQSLWQHQQPQTYSYLPQQQNTSMVVSEASRRLTRQNLANQSLPIQPSMPIVSEYTHARYLFISSKDSTPFLVKIPKLPPITLGDVKRHLPMKGFYRFFFKTEINGEEVFQQEDLDSAEVPLWKDTVYVRCSND